MGLNRIRLRKRVAPGPSRRWKAWYLQQLIIRGSGKFCRNAYLFNGIDQYAKFPQRTFSGDFALEVEFIAHSLSNQVLLGDINNADSYIGLRSTGAIRVRVGALSYTTTNLNYITFTYYKLRIERKGTDITVTLNDNSESLTANSNDLVLNVIGQSATTSNFHGLIFNYWNSLGYNYPMDESWDYRPIMRNSLTSLGVEKVSNGTFDNSSNWLLGVGWSIQNGRAELASDGSPASLQQNNVFEVGKTYIIEFDVFSDSSPIGIQNLAGQIIASSASGKVRLVFTTDTPHLSFKRVFGSPNGWIDNISVKEAVGYGEYVNITLDSLSEVCFDAEGNFLGSRDFNGNDFNSSDFN